MAKIIKIIWLITLVLSIIYALIFIWNHPIAPDTWTHMNIGRYVVENKKIPIHSDISYKDVEPEFKFVSHSWLSDVLIYLAKANNSPYTVFVLVGSVLCLSLYILFKALKLLQATYEIRMMSLALSSTLALTFWRLHPIIFAVPLTLSILYLFLLYKNGSYRALYALPVVFLLYAQMGGGYIFIPLLFLIAILAIEIVKKTIFFSKTDNVQDKKIRIKPLLIISIISVLITVLNPWGMRVWVYGPVALYLVKPINWYGNLLGILNVTSQSFIKNSPSIIPYALFTIYMLGTMLITFTFIVRKPKLLFPALASIASLFFFFILPFYWVRYIPLATFLTIPIMAVVLQKAVEHIEKNKKIQAVHFGLAVTALIAFAYLLFNPFKAFAFDPPLDQLRYIRNNNLPSNVITSQDITGVASYYLYPKKTLIDIQDDLYDETASIELYGLPQVILKKSFDSIIEVNGANTILTNKDYASLALTLNADPNWALVYYDDNGFVFVKKSEVNESFLKKNALIHLKLDRSLGFDIKEATAAAQELRRFTKVYKSRMALGQLATIYRLNGQLDLAESTLTQIPKQKWDFTVYTEMGRVKAAQGLCKEAEYNLLQAVNGKGEQNFSRAVLDLAVVYAGCLQDKEKAEHFFRRYDSFMMPPAEHGRVRNIADDFGINITEN